MKKLLIPITIVIILCTLLFAFLSRIDEKMQNRHDIQIRLSASDVHSLSVGNRKSESLAINQYIENLSLEEKVCQLFITNLEGRKSFTPVERNGALSGSPRSGSALIPGGYLFFSYNVADSPEEIIDFTDSIRNYCIGRSIIPPFLAIDQEGGFVNRLRHIAGPLPSCTRVAQCLGIAEAYELYSLQAKQLSALGFNVNLAPVAEICTEANEKFLNGRSFGCSWNVKAYGTAAVNGFQNNKIGAVLKHFPGNTNTDPHTGLPEIVLPLEELEASLVPFNRLLSLNPAGILMSHSRTSAVDSRMPACISKKWVTDRLRGGLGYEGIIFSDDIFMAALADNGYPPEKAAVMAIEAGVDCIMISEKRFAGPALILIQKAQEDPEFVKKIDAAVRRVLVYKLRTGIFQLERAEDGTMRPARNYVCASPEDRTAAFYDAKQKNTDLYIRCFTSVSENREYQNGQK